MLFSTCTICTLSCTTHRWFGGSEKVIMYVLTHKGGWKSAWGLGIGWKTRRREGTKKHQQGQAKTEEIRQKS